MNEIKHEEKLFRGNENYQIDTDKMLPIINTLSRTSMTLAKLAEITDYKRRLGKIESLKYIPQEILQEAKQRVTVDDSKLVVIMDL